MDRSAGSRSDWWMAGLLGVVLFTGALLVRANPVRGLLLASVGSSALLVLLWGRWRHRLPLSPEPWARSIVLSLLLAAAILAWQFSLPMSVAGPDPLLLGAFRERMLLMTLAFFFVPATIFTELYLRGFLYSLLEARGGVALAVAGSTAASLVLFAPVLGMNALALSAGIAVFLVLALSRRWTGSLAPALLAQGLVGLVSSVFLFALGVASGPGGAPTVQDEPPAVEVEAIDGGGAAG